MTGKNHTRLLFSCLGLILFAIGLNGQLTRMPILNVDQNLTYQTIFQDVDSRIWVGTNHGLALFDGKSLGLIPFSEDITKVETITAIFEDRNGVLWIGGEQGGIFQKNLNRVKSFINEEGHPSKKIVGFAETNTQLWIATYGEGVYYFEQGRMYHIGIDDGLSSLDVYAMVVGPDNRIWVGTDNGINVIQAERNQKMVEHMTKDFGLSDDIITSLFVLDQDVLAGYYEPKIDRITGMDRIIQFQTNSTAQIDHITCTHQNMIWYATSDGDVFKMDRKLKEIKSYQLIDLSNPAISDMIIDHEGILWVVDQNRGLFQYNTRFDQPRFDFNQVQAIVVDSKQVRYIGTGKGVYTWRPEDSLVTKICNDNVASLYHDGTFLWSGSLGHGLSIYENKQEVQRLTRGDGLSENYILDITAHGSSIFLSTLGGVTELSDCSRPQNITRANIVSYDQDDGLGTNYIYHGVVDESNRIWFGTDGDGLASISNGSVNNFKIMGTDTVKSVYCVTLDPQNNLWLSSDKGDIYKYDYDSFQPLASWNERAFKEEVLGLQATRDGHIYIIGQKALFILDISADQISKFSNYAQPETFVPTLNAIHLDQNGMLWIGGEQGYLTVDTRVNPLNKQAKISLNQVTVLDRPIDPKKERSFKSDENYLTFEYSGQWYTDPHQLVYRFRMNGIEDNWNVTRESTITYHHLPPGDYQFIVQASQDGSFRNSHLNQLEYQFEILNPIWKQTWFIVLATLCAVGLLFFILRIRERQLQKEAQRKKELITAQFEMLKSQINPHFLFNSFNTLVSIIEENPDHAVEYVEYLSDFYRSILQYREKNLISLDEEIALVKNYMYLIKKRFGDAVQLKIDLNLDPSMVAPLSLQLLVENAVKHNIISSRQPLLIEISSEEADYITVQNNLQPKTTAGDSTHYGLNSLKERYALLSQKSIEIEQTKDLFTVKIPRIKITEHARIDH